MCLPGWKRPAFCNVLLMYSISRVSLELVARDPLQPCPPLPRTPGSAMASSGSGPRSHTSSHLRLWSSSAIGGAAGGAGGRVRAGGDRCPRARRRGARTPKASSPGDAWPFREPDAVGSLGALRLSTPWPPCPPRARGRGHGGWKGLGIRPTRRAHDLGPVDLGPQELRLPGWKMGGLLHREGLAGGPGASLGVQEEEAPALQGPKAGGEWVLGWPPGEAGRAVGGASGGHLSGPGAGRAPGTRPDQGEGGACPWRVGQGEQRPQEAWPSRLKSGPVSGGWETLRLQ